VRRGTAVARRYAKALVGLVPEERREAVAEELEAFARLMAEQPDLGAALLRPWVKGGEKGKVARAVAERAGLGHLARDFLGVVAHQARLDLLAEIVAAYRREVDRAAGRARARVRAARPLGEAERERLRGYLARRLGRTVLLDVEEDPGLLGGFVAEIDSQVLDGSLRGRLDALRGQLIRG